MVSKLQQQQVRQLITQTLTVLCQNSLPYNAVVTIEGLLGITIDHDDVFLVNIQQSIQRPLPPQSANAGQMPVQYIRPHAAGNHIPTPLTQHSPHELLHSPHGPITTPHGSLPSPRGSLPSPQSIPQTIPHGIPPSMMTSQRHGTPSPCQPIDPHIRKRPPAMTSRTPEPGIMGMNEPADYSMRSLSRHRSRNRSMSPLAKVPRVSPPGAQSDVEKRVSMILQTAQAEMKAMEINKRRHAQHYNRHKTEAPSDVYKKRHNNHLTPEHAQMIIKVEPQPDSGEVSPRRTPQGNSDKENYPEAWNILPELTAKWYKQNGRSPGCDIIAGEDTGSDITNHNDDITEASKDTSSEHENENTKEDDIAKQDGQGADNVDDVTNDATNCSVKDSDSTEDNPDVTKTRQCSTVGTIVIVKQEMEEQSDRIIPEDKQSVVPSDEGNGN